MRRVPCEYIFWTALPIIRREIAECMINNFGLNQKEAANKLGITPAAICQYLSNKRGKIKILDKKILHEINSSAGRIIQNGETAVPLEMCRICKILKSVRILPFNTESTTSIHIAEKRI